MNWSDDQKEIFKFVESGEGSAVVEAVPGSGKSTTIKECYRRLSFIDVDTLYLSFNKSAAEHLVASGLPAKTFHSLGYLALRHQYPSTSVRANKTREIIRDVMPKNIINIYSGIITRLVSLAKQIGVNVLIEDDVAVWDALINHHGLYLDADDANLNVAITLAREVFNESIQRNKDVIDFDDMLYVPVCDNLDLVKYDLIFIDEAQDTNTIQRTLLKRSTHDKSRIIAVGDRNQAIYGFRGASSDSMIELVREFNCTRLPLTISYRCSKSVVEHARKWVKRIQPAPGAPQGSVETLREWDTSIIKPDDLVLCRYNRPIIKLAYSMLSKGQTVPHVLGRDVATRLKSMINRARATNVGHLRVRLESKQQQEIERAVDRNDYVATTAIVDRYGSLFCIINDLNDNDTIRDLINVIDVMFNSKSNCARLCTVHKAKGLEANTVYWLDYDFEDRETDLDWQRQQENNIRYVAATRAKTKLVLLKSNYMIG